MSTHTKIGTVQLMVERIYQIDPNSTNPNATTAVVAPGPFPVYREMDAIYWMMSGKLNSRGIHKIGDGMFMGRTGDSADGPEVTFPSRRYSVEEFRDLLLDPVCANGSPIQRLQFALDVKIPEA